MLLNNFVYSLIKAFFNQNIPIFKALTDFIIIFNFKQVEATCMSLRIQPIPFPSLIIAVTVVTSPY